jgi:hypothetical protein
MARITETVDAAGDIAIIDTGTIDIATIKTATIDTHAGGNAAKEPVIISTPTGRIMRAPVDGAAQEDINLQNPANRGGLFDLTG